MRLSSMIPFVLGGAALTAAVAVLPVVETTVFDEAISRSFTVLNTSRTPPPFEEAISRSFTVLNTTRTPPPFDEAISRAFTVCNAAGAGCVCDGSPCDDGNACTVGETCQSGVCTGGAPPDCSSAGGPCNTASCDPNGTEGNCDILTPVPEGTSCGNPSDTPCDNPDTCDGAGSCQANNEPAGTNCGDAEAQCVYQDTCNGSGSCTDNGFKPTTTACNDDNPCTLTDRCSGNSAACLSGTYAWTGVLQPINTDGSSIFKLGSTIPTKFKLTGPCTGNGALTFKIFVSKLTNAVLGDELEPISTSAADTGNTFRYDATDGQYIFNLATRGLSAGTWRIRIAQYQGRTELATLGNVEVSLRK